MITNIPKYVAHSLARMGFILLPLVSCTTPQRSFYSQAPDQHFEIVASYIEKFYIDDKGSGIELDRSASPDLDSLFQQLDGFSRIAEYSGMEKIDSNDAGIGIIVRKHYEHILVSDIFEDGPAFQSSLPLNAHLLEVDGESTAGMELMSLIKKLRGPAGSEVILSYEDPDTGTTDQITLVRSVISPSSSIKEFFVDEGIAYIRIRSFSTKVSQELSNKLINRKNEIRGIVLDLRSNKGGSLAEVISTIELFTPRERTIFILQTAKGRFEQKSKLDAPFEHIPLVILVNAHTAAGAECVALSLQENGKAVLVGEQTEGSAQIQTSFALSKGYPGAVILTTAYWLGPEGEGIHGVGIAPDINTPLSDQSFRALLRDRIKEGNMSSSELSEDIQFQKALEVLEEWLAVEI